MERKKPFYVRPLHLSPEGEMPGIIKLTAEQYKQIGDIGLKKQSETIDAKVKSKIQNDKKETYELSGWDQRWDLAFSSIPAPKVESVKRERRSSAAGGSTREKKSQAAGKQKMTEAEQLLTQQLGLQQEKFLKVLKEMATRHADREQALIKQMLAQEIAGMREDVTSYVTMFGTLDEKLKEIQKKKEEAEKRKERENKVILTEITDGIKGFFGKFRKKKEKNNETKNNDNNSDSLTDKKQGPKEKPKTWRKVVGRWTLALAVLAGTVGGGIGGYLFAEHQDDDHPHYDHGKMCPEDQDYYNYEIDSSWPKSREEAADIFGTDGDCYSKEPCNWEPSEDGKAWIMKKDSTSKHYIDTNGYVAEGSRMNDDDRLEIIITADDDEIGVEEVTIYEYLGEKGAQKLWKEAQHDHPGAIFIKSGFPLPSRH